MKIIQKEFIFLYNFDSGEQDIVNEVVKYIGLENTKILGHGVYSDGGTSEWNNSLWITEDHYLLAFTAYHFAYFMDKVIPFNEYHDTDIEYARYWMDIHKNDPKNFTILS